MPSVALQGSRPGSRSTRGGLPLASHRVRPSFLRSFTLRIGPWPSLPQSPLYSPLQPIADAYRRTCSQGFGAPGLRAPGRRRPFAPSRPLHPRAVARALDGAPAQPRTCTTRPRLKCRRVHVVHRPDAQGKGSRRRSSACLAPWPAARWAAQGPAAAAVARALARLRSFLALPGLVVPRRAGAKCKCICLLNAQAEPTAQAMGGQHQPPAR